MDVVGCETQVIVNMKGLVQGGGRFETNKEEGGFGCRGGFVKTHGWGF